MTFDEDPGGGFGRPTYGGLRQLLHDQAGMVRRMGDLRRDASSGLVNKAFRERLMLVHTHVIGCRYCSWAHTRVALRSGVTPEQVGALLCGAVEGCPEDEGPALLYAIHFAETDGHPDADARSRLVEVYGEARADAIDRALMAIRSGNLLGNSLDHFLFRITGGRLGLRRRGRYGEPGVVDEAVVTG